MGKRLVVVQHADGKREYVCKKCDAKMIHDDSTQSVFSQGEYSENGREQLVCPNCGMTNEYPRIRCSDFKHIPAIG